MECPRDAWQALPQPIPSERKREHLRNLLAAGFSRIDLGSFVSPRAVPQLADSEEVLESLDRPAGADFICIVANMRGLERAAGTGKVTSVGYPLSVNETFQLRNTGMDLHRSWRLVAELARGAEEAGLELVFYLSMGFGNPYGERWRPADTAGAVARARDLGAARLALADTAGRADERRLEEVLAACADAQELGLHLHARPDGWEPLLRAAWAAGVRWFEGALAGAGGCPFAGDELVGNLPSEVVLPWLDGKGGSSGVRLDALEPLAREARELVLLGEGEP